MFFDGKIRKRLLKTLILLMIGIPLLSVCSNLYGLTPENTIIDNTVTITYQDELQVATDTANSDTATAVTGYTCDVSLSSAGDTKYGNQGETVYFSFYSQNLGNGSDSFYVTIQGTWAHLMYLDTVTRNGMYDTGEPVIDTIYLAANDSRPLVFAVRVPDTAANFDSLLLIVTVGSSRDTSCTEAFRALAICSGVIGFSDFRISVETPVYQYGSYRLTITAIDGAGQVVTGYGGPTILLIDTTVIYLTVWNNGMVTYILTFIDTRAHTVSVVDAADSSKGETIYIAAAPDTSPAIAPLICPLNVKIRGNEVALISIFSDTLVNVNFEYRRAGTMDTWTFINNDTMARRWGVYWNTDSLAAGAYELRVVGSTAGNTDATPGIYQITIDTVDYDIDEYRDSVTNEHVKRQRLQPAGTNVTLLLDGCRVEIPAAVVPATTYFRATVHNAAPHPAPNRPEITDIGVYRSFAIESGQTWFNQNLTLRIGFDDAGSGESKYRIFTYVPSPGVWSEVPNSYVNTGEDYVEVSINHFSLFAVFGFTPSTDLSRFEIYPNPFKPNDGDDDTGKDWTADDNTSGIIFANVTASVRIQVYTIAGKQVIDRYLTNTGGNVRWDVRNDAGEKVASGMYIAVITADSGQRVVRKIMIVR